MIEVCLPVPRVVYRHTEATYESLKNEAVVKKRDPVGLTLFLRDGLISAPKLATEALKYAPVIEHLPPENLAYLLLFSLFSKPIRDSLEFSMAVHLFDVSKIQTPTPEVLKESPGTLYNLLYNTLHEPQTSEPPMPTARFLFRNARAVIDVIGRDEAGQNLFVHSFYDRLDPRVLSLLDRKFDAECTKIKIPRNTHRLIAGG